jgi:hypothetical protein
VNSAGLVELVPYNLLTYSEQFDNADWPKADVTVISNATTAPNGTLTADKLIESATNSNHLLNRTGVTLSPLNASFYAKAGERNWARLQTQNPFNGWVNVNLTTGAIGQSGGFLTNIQVTNVGDGWWRISATNTNDSLSKGLQLFVIDSDRGGSSPSYLGDGTSGIYIWGAQLVEGSSALDYFATETRLNIPRLDYSNGSCPNILLEPQRTNVCRDSNNLSGGSWLNATTNTTITRIQSGGPDGNAFDRLVVGGASGSNQGRIVQTATLPASNAIFTIYLRGTGQVSIGMYNAGQSDVTDITLTSEWTRYESAITSGTAGYMDFSVYVFGGASVDVSCAQLEFATYATSYIPTESASVTRNTDVLTRAGFGNTSTSGTLFFDFYAEKIQSSNGMYMLQLFAGSSIGGTVFADTNGLSIIANGPAIQIFNNGYTQQVQTFTPTQGQRVKIAVRYNGTNVSSAINGTLSSVFADTAVGVKNALGINNGENSTHAFNAVAFFPSYLTDGEMSMLTSGVYTPALAYAQLGLVSESPACLDSSINALL